MALLVGFHFCYTTGLRPLGEVGLGSFDCIYPKLVPGGYRTMGSHRHHSGVGEVPGTPKAGSGVPGPAERPEQSVLRLLSMQVPLEPRKS